ncbi:MAG: NUDIX domain-containing protein [Minisyncoccia bacterium]|jgi:colanic acid biosynthesis protein WcaH
MEKPFTFEEFRAIYSKVPRLCVIVVVKTNKGIVLALRKLSSWNNLWHIPGGTVYYKETMHDAVRRVASDELGISVRIKDCLGYIDAYPSEEKEVGFGSTVSLVFLCEIKKGRLMPNEDASEIKIFKKLPKNMIAEEKEYLKKINFGI